MSITNLLVGTALHKGTRAITICTEPVNIGNKGRPNWRCDRHIARAAASSSARVQGPKLNNAAVVLEYLLTNRLAVLRSEDGAVYIEKHDKEGNVVSKYYGSETQLHTTTDEMPELYGGYIAAVMYGLLSEKMPETWELFSDCVSEYKSNGAISPETLFKYCDSFYFEWTAVCKDRVECVDDLDDNEVKQGVRTRALQVPHELTDLGMTIPYSKVAESILKELEEVDKSSAKPVASATDPFEACKNGDHVINYCWNADQLSRIPGTGKLNDYVACNEFFTMVNLIEYNLKAVMSRMDKGEYGVNAIGQNFVNCIILGKPGTGKTRLANALGATFGLPVYTAAVSKNSEEDTFHGMTKVAEGGFKFVPTAFLECYKNGGIVILEEFNLSDPAVMMGALGQALVAPFVLLEDGYKEIRRHPLCIVIATMNPETQGSREPSEAFTSRCPLVIMLDDPEKEEFVKILSVGGYSLKDCRRVYDAYQRIQTYLCGPTVNARDIAMSVTLRHCQEALVLMNTGCSFKAAVRNSMVNTIAIKDYALAQQTYKAVVEPLKGE